MFSCSTSVKFTSSCLCPNKYIYHTAFISHMCTECWRMKQVLVRHFSVMIRLIVTCKLLSSKRKSSTCLTGKRACFLMNSCWIFYVPCSPLIFQSRAPPPSGHTAGWLALFLLLRATGLGNTCGGYTVGLQTCFRFEKTITVKLVFLLGIPVLQTPTLMSKPQTSS